MMSKNAYLSQYKGYNIQVLPRDSPVRPPQPTTLTDTEITKSNIHQSSPHNITPVTSLEEETNIKEVREASGVDRATAYSALKAANGDVNGAVNLIFDKVKFQLLTPPPEPANSQPPPTSPDPQPTPTRPDPQPTPTRPGSYGPVSDDILQQIGRKLENNAEKIDKVLDEMFKQDKEMAKKVLENWDAIRHRMNITVPKSELKKRT